MTRPAYLSQITNAVYLWAAWHVWPLAPTVAIAYAALGVCSAGFHITGRLNWRTADVMAMWGVVGSLIGLCLHPVASALLGAGLAIYYPLTIASRRWNIWTGRAMVPAILVLIACAVARWVWEGRPSGFVLPMAIAVALMGTAYGFRIVSERAYGSADGPDLTREKDVADRVPIGRLGWYADLGHSGWHLLSGRALPTVTVAICSLT